MAGFYSASQGTYPTESQWPTNWSPVPVHTVPLEDDFAIWAYPDCPRLLQTQNEQFDSPEFAKVMEENKDLFELIEKHANSTIKDFTDLYIFANTLMIERYHNLTLPEWVTEDVYKRSSRLANDGFDFMFGGAAFGKPENVEMVALSGGNIIKEMIENIEKKISGENKYKYQVFSGHDSTVAGLLRTFGAKEAVLGDDLPDYASVVVVELWELAPQDYSVRVRHSKNVESPFVAITNKIEGCPKYMDLCPVKTFIENRQKYIFKDIKQACQVASTVRVPL
uniref:Acid phosphatase n=1 Tax=Steinernema glaseri TaxID=37863 RepID=A0A1I7ZU05_9BILA